MGVSSKQLPLPFIHDEDFSQHRFHVTPSNLEAVRLVRHCLQESRAFGMIYGSAASGKSHLASATARQVGVELYEADSLDLAALERPAPVVLIDHLDRISARPDHQETVVHYINHLHGHGCLLLFGHTLPAMWPSAGQLPDFVSRINALFAVAEILEPDDQLLRLILSKCAADRGFHLPVAVVNFWLSRMPRSYQAALILVEELDHITLARQSKIGISAAKQALERIAQ